MKFNDHSKLEGRHAFLGASQSAWLRKNDDQILDAWAKQYVKAIGTALHDIARKHIQYAMKIAKSSKKEIYLSLIADYHIPELAIERGIDWDMVFDNLVIYTNDCIGYRMLPEQILYFSDNCFGTADAINSLDNILKNKILRIHDLKTGVTPVHMEQLMVYAALFCLEYDVRPAELDYELRIYQKREVIECFPEIDEISHVCDLIQSRDKLIQNNMEG